MVAHESRCIKNPETKSCPTCEHNVHENSEEPDYESGYPGYDGGYFCVEDHVPKGKKLVTQCPHWHAKKDSRE